MPLNSSDQKAVGSAGVSVGRPADSLLAGSSAELDCATSATELLEIDSLLLLDSSTTLGMTFKELLEGTAAELDSVTVLSAPAGLSEEQAKKTALAIRNISVQEVFLTSCIIQNLISFE